MKFWVKKLLAKYVTYIEIIGYGFVILFVAGLIILSRVKAEDEFVSLKGELKISKQLISFAHDNFMIRVLADTGQFVPAGALLMKVTNDPIFVADKKIVVTLDEQIALAGKIGNNSLVNQLKSVKEKLTSKKYPHLRKTEIRSTISGEFWLVSEVLPFISKDISPGGVFDFENCVIHVNRLPVDKRMKRKLKVGQTGTAAIQISPSKKIEMSVELVNLSEDEADLKLGELSSDKKKKLAGALTTLPKDKRLSATISVLVGAKSWMQLIWR